MEGLFTVSDFRVIEFWLYTSGVVGAHIRRYIEGNRGRTVVLKGVKNAVAPLKYLPNKAMGDFLNSEYYQAYEESWHSDIGFSNPALAESIQDAAQYGCDGRTHADCIQLQIDAIRAAENDDEMWEEEVEFLLDFLSGVWDWHVEHGTIDDMIG
jgi:hypothetical protein